MGSQSKAKRRLDWLPVAMIFLSFLLALAVAFKHRGDSLAGLVDEVEYNRLALGLLAGRGYDSTYRLPGFPAFVALVYAIAGKRFVAVFAVHAVLWAVCLALVYRIALLVTESRRVSIVALALCVLWWPFYPGLVPTMMTEMLASVLIALSVYAMLSALLFLGKPEEVVKMTLLSGTEISIEAADFMFLIVSLAQMGNLDEAKKQIQQGLASTRLIRPRMEALPRSHWLRVQRFPMSDEAREALRPFFVQV